MTFSASSNKLLEGLNNMTTASLFIKKQAECQIKAFNCLSKWAADNDNAAIKDVVIKSNDIFKIFGDKLIQLASEQEAFVKELKKIEQIETSIKCAEKKLERSLEKEKKYEKEIKKYSRSSSSSFFKTKKQADLGVLHHDLKTARSVTFNCRKELSNIRAEMEVVKMFRFRKGMEKMCVAWRNFSNDISSIFICQQELVEMVPAVSTEDVREMLYEGAYLTKSIVDDLKKKLNYHNKIDDVNKVEEEDSTKKIPYLIKNDETLIHCTATTVSSNFENRLLKIFTNPEKLSYDSDYSSSKSLEICTQKDEKFPTVTHDKEGSYENLYPLLPSNPYKNDKQFGSKNYTLSSSNNLTIMDTFLIRKSI
uniref:FCH domain-containing protein n=1 Tax=Strongyloides venezuelensis TaxID=75913 RepID=A0A0K0FC08_STRVS